MSASYENKKIALEWTMISSDAFSTKKGMIIKKKKGSSNKHFRLTYDGRLIK